MWIYFNLRGILGSYATQFVIEAGHDEIVHASRVAKPNVPLGGMNIHVYVRGVHGQVQDKHGVPTVKHDIPVPLFDAVRDQGILHMPAVDEEILTIRGTPSESGKPDPSHQSQVFALQVNFNALVRKASAENTRNPIEGGLLHLHFVDDAAIVHQGECAVWICNRQDANAICHMVHFRS